MTFHRLWPLAASLVAVLLGARASAQVRAFSDGFGVSLDGEPLTNAPLVLIDQARCAKGVEFTLSVSGLSVPEGINTLEFWAAPSPGADCGFAMNRAVSTSVPTLCWLLGAVEHVTTSATLSVDAHSIFRPDLHPGFDTCPGDDGDAVALFAVPLAAPSANNPSAPPEPLSGIPVHKATLTLGPAPTAPFQIRGERTSEMLKVTWARARDGRPKSTYTVYWDTSVGSDASCSSSRLREGEVAPELEADDAFLFTTTTNGTSASSPAELDLSSLRAEDYVAVAVVHRTPAGSVSALSEVVCVGLSGPTIIWDPAPEPREDGDGCSVRAGVTGRGGHDLGALVFAGAWLLVRRSQRARVAAQRGTRPDRVPTSMSG